MTNAGCGSEIPLARAPEWLPRLCFDKDYLLRRLPTEGNMRFLHPRARRRNQLPMALYQPARFHCPSDFEEIAVLPTTELVGNCERALMVSTLARLSRQSQRSAFLREGAEVSDELPQ